MQIVVTDAGVELTDPDVFTEFSVVSGLEADALSTALDERAWGSADEEHAWIDAAALKEAGLGATSLAEQEWVASFDAMIAYADKQGWVVDSRVRAHVERPA